MFGHPTATPVPGHQRPHRPQPAPPARPREQLARAARPAPGHLGASAAATDGARAAVRKHIDFVPVKHRPAPCHEARRAGPRWPTRLTRGAGGEGGGLNPPRRGLAGAGGAPGVKISGFDKSPGVKSGQKKANGARAPDAKLRVLTCSRKDGRVASAPVRSRPRLILPRSFPVASFPLRRPAASGAALRRVFLSLARGLFHHPRSHAEEIDMTSNKSPSPRVASASSWPAGWAPTSTRVASPRAQAARLRRPPVVGNRRSCTLQHSGGLVFARDPFGLEIVDQCGHSDGQPAAPDRYSLAT